MVGGSIGVAGIGSFTSGSQMVSATLAFSNPAITTMSPASPTSIGTFFVPSYLKILVNLPSSTFVSSKIYCFNWLISFCCSLRYSFLLNFYLKNYLHISKVDSIAKGFVLSSSAGLTCSIIKFNKWMKIFSWHHQLLYLPIQTFR